MRLINPDLVSDLGDALAADYDVDADLGGGHVSVLSGMVNGLFDFSQPTWGAYVGAGVGLAKVKVLGDSDSGIAMQGLIGFYVPVSDNVDIGVKYRYFRTGKLRLGNDFDDGVDVVPFSARGRLESHSLLLGLTYNFYTAPPLRHRRLRRRHLRRQHRRRRPARMDR